MAGCPQGRDRVKMWAWQEMHSLGRLGGPGSWRWWRRSGTIFQQAAPSLPRRRSLHASQQVHLAGQAVGAQKAWPMAAGPAIGLEQGRALLPEKEWHKLRAQPWELEPMGAALGVSPRTLELGPEGQQRQHRKNYTGYHTQSFAVCLKSHYFRFSHQPNEESIVITIILMSKLRLI